jgi:uncharacterized membrane protein YfcA
LIPDPVLKLQNYELHKDAALMILFAFLLLVSAYKMIANTKPDNDSQPDSRFALVLNGLIVGCITGLLGAGGGFLIVPALVLIQRLDFKVAAGTSLCIIAINSAVGFLSNRDFILQIDWNFLLIFTSFAIMGILVGSYASNWFSSQKLKPAFGYLLIVIACFILFKEFN